MAYNLHIPDLKDVKWAEVNVTAGTRDGRSNTERKRIPDGLVNWVAVLGEAECEARIAANTAIKLQGGVRPAKNGKPKAERKRPLSVLEQLEEQRLAELAAKSAAKVA